MFEIAASAVNWPIPCRCRWQMKTRRRYGRYPIFSKEILTAENIVCINELRSLVVSLTFIKLCVNIILRWNIMDFIKFVDQIPNITIAKRVASAYVADYRRLELDEIKRIFEKNC